MAGNTVNVLIKADDQASKAIGDVNDKANGLGSTLASVGKVAAGFLAAEVIGKGIGMLTDGFNDSIAAAKESAMVQAQLGAVLKSTGGAAGVSAEQVNALATQLESASLFTDEQVTSAESLLLTFTNIGGDVMPTATQAVVDMSQALGQDLKSSSVQVGKALNDPIKGITALSRVGVSFTDQQKEQIKTMVEAGDVAGAQGIILAELAKEFGGSAQAANDAAGATRDHQIAMDALQETIGAKLIPIQDLWMKAQEVVIGFVADKVLPALFSFADIINTQLWPALSKLADTLSTNLLPPLTEASHFFELGFNGGQVGGDLDTISTAAFKVGDTFRNTLLPAAQEAFDFVRDKLTELSDHVQTQFARWPQYYEENVKPAMDNIQDLVTTVVAWFRDHWPEIETIVTPVLEMIKNEVETMATVVTGLLNIVILLIKGDWSGAWDAAKQLVADVVAAIIQQAGLMRDLVVAALNILKDLGIAAIQGLFDGMQNIWSGTIQPWLSGLPMMIKGAIGNLGMLLWDVGTQILQGLWDGMKNKWSDVSGWVAARAADVKGIFGSILRMGSPSKEMEDVGINIMAGLDNGIHAGWSKLTPFLTSIADAIARWGDGIVNEMTDTFKQALAISAAIAAESAKGAAAQPVLTGSTSSTGTSGSSGGSSSGSSGRPPVPGPDATREEKDAYINWMNTHQMAKGGLVRARAGGTLALLGEGGNDEAVIPLTGGAGHGLGGTVNLYVQGSILSERDIIRIIRNELLNGGMSDIFTNFGLGPVGA